MVAQTEEWTGEGVTVSALERELARLRRATFEHTDGPDLRTSVMTHMAWVPDDWLSQATATLAGLAERHPSRTIVLVPDPAGADRLDADLSVQCFPVSGRQGNVCTEVIELRLGGSRAAAPASIVQPLLIADLPVFLRWRGEPPFGGTEFDQLVEVTDRLVVYSSEWSDLPGAYGRLSDVFGRTAVSDIAWSRTLEWRWAVAQLWPAVAEPRTLRVAGPNAEALLLAGWLRSRLGGEVALEHEQADVIERVEIDGRAVEAPHVEPRTPSDLLSDELDNFARDPVYEESVRATH